MKRASLTWRAPGLLLVALLALAGVHPMSTLAAPLQQGTSSTVITVDTPPQEANGNLRLYMTGWAADTASPTGTGIRAVEVYLDGPRGQGGVFLARATYGQPRADVGRGLGGTQFNNSGWAVEADIPPGQRAIYVYAQAADGWAGPAVLSYNAQPGGPSPALASVAPTQPPGPPATGPAFQSSAYSYGAGYPYFSGGGYNYPGFGHCVQFEQPTGRCISWGGSNYTSCLIGDPNSGRCLSYTSYPYGFGWPYIGNSLPYSGTGGSPYPYESSGYQYGPVNIQPYATGYQGPYPPSTSGTGPGWTGAPLIPVPATGAPPGSAPGVSVPRY